MIQRFTKRRQFVVAGVARAAVRWSGREEKEGKEIKVMHDG